MKKDIFLQSEKGAEAQFQRRANPMVPTRPVASRTWGGTQTYMGRDAMPFLMWYQIIKFCEKSAVLCRQTSY